MADQRYTLNKLCARGPEWIIVAASHSDLDEALERHHFLLHAIQGEWREEFFPDVHFQRLRFLRGETEALLALTVDGNLLRLSRDGLETERIDPSGNGPSEVAWALDLRQIGRSMYVCGMGRLVYRQTVPGRWDRIDQGLRTEPRAGFQVINGFSEDEIYSAGFGGELWFRDRGDWQPIVSPTNLILQTLACGEGEVAYVGGARGTLLRGRGDHWEVVPQDATSKTLWASEFFQGSLYAITSTDLFRLQDDNLSRVEVPYADTGALTDLVTTPDALWVLGHNKVMMTDGEEWQEWPAPSRG